MTLTEFYTKQLEMELQDDITHEFKQSSSPVRHAYQLRQGDCLELMKSIPDQSIGMILCDLPYGTTRNKWDSVIPLEALWAQYKRIIKPNGVIALTSQGVFTAKLIMSNEAWFRYKLVWMKSKATNFLNAKKQPLRKHEDICIFYNKPPYYNPVMSPGIPYDRGRTKRQQTGCYGDFGPIRNKNESGDRYPTDVIYFSTAEAEGKVYHPTQKPVALGRYLIKTYLAEGEIMLDNAFGSGSFLVAAVLEDRKCIGIEKNEGALLFKKEPIDLMRIAAMRLGKAVPL